jgi:DNA-binding transcriptional LysR family regulator
MATVSGVELTIAGMRVVREVAAHGSFTGAADALGYTQSAISRQVAAMELAAGSPLFERHARGVRPTAAGVILLRHAATVLQGVEAAQLELTGMDQRLAGRLAVGVFPAALGVVVPRALAALRAGHPAIDIRLREGTTPAHLRRLRAGALDIAVIGAGPDLAYELEGLTVDELLTGDLLLAVGAGHHFADCPGCPWPSSRQKSGSSATPRRAARSSDHGRRSRASRRSATRCATGPRASASSLQAWA